MQIIIIDIHKKIVKFNKMKNNMTNFNKNKGYYLYYILFLSL